MNLPLINCAQRHPYSIAIAFADQTYTYGDLLYASSQIASKLLQNEEDLQEKRVAFLIAPSFEYVATQWGIWRAGGIAVPLCTAHPRPELEYVITNSGASILVADPDLAARLEPIARERNLPLILTSDTLPVQLKTLPEISISRRALILYTSGTTGKPKGVVTTHHNIQSQVMSLITAWEWTSSDRILQVLPLHHIHGVINVLTCALWVGAQCQMMPKFDAELVWQKFCQSDLTIFMAVPTVYVKLIAAWEKADADRQRIMSEACAKMRLMVCGSAALPVQVLEKWQSISGHILLERYGMTEIGMALSNPLRGKREAGSVGKPLPSVEVRLVDDQGYVASQKTGEIQVKGPGVFLEYWQNSEATAKCFRDGWFCTGDLAVIEDDNYRILGRISVDIIKTGGYKVSALEIEEILRTHPDIEECAVVGIPDLEWGERVGVALVVRSPRVARKARSPQGLTLEALRMWAKERLAVYKIPSRMLIVEELPRNTMGKVTKPKVVDLFKD
ncbi:acyl-CoA synthetase [Gloeocapsa sp. PCC 73106]|uniref:acyl-CoA synthetase n=1 Tax=Gloeocapsa sp. PCC 73106 TaxID=102232 RepID=UPI0002ABF0C0|nr:acyl-CoA synthetase [Gloeocapsa sp. PCC 73106]ELR96923.1 acyl-CoA synthetase (AMP-forming)/AMP-acid ligase II [Gloeocapsa sp. PCC 73106]